MTKTFSFAALLILVSSTACHSHPSKETDPKTLFVGLSAPPTNLDPRLATDANSQRIDDLIFTSLVRNGPQLQPVPQGALSWKIENRQVTFFLRKDLKFSDGQPVTAQDVVFSFSEYQKPGSPFASSLKTVQ